jgi:hypothetical protein
MSTPEGKSYKDTLFLPKTDFPMKGNLTVREPARLDKWNSEDLTRELLLKEKLKMLRVSSFMMALHLQTGTFIWGLVSTKSSKTSW